MVKSELVRRIAELRPRLYPRDIEKIIDSMVDQIGDALGRGDRVEIRGFGIFLIKQRTSRRGRNPKTGVAVAIPEKRALAFKSGKDMRARLNAASATASPPAADEPYGA